MSDDHSCPVPATHHKFKEAEYFLLKMLDHYHDPWEFQFNLNAFIQAFRNITFMLQAELGKPAGFDVWYVKKQEEMRSNQLLRRFVLARNIVVKQSNLQSKSQVWSGMFRGRRMKLAFKHEIPVFTSTVDALENAKKFAIGFFLDDEHSSIGEQIGVERTWVVEELGEGEVVAYCLEVMNYMGRLIAEIHGLAGIEAEHEEMSVPMERIQVLLETDVDPGLVEKWGW